VKQEVEIPSFEIHSVSLSFGMASFRLGSAVLREKNEIVVGKEGTPDAASRGQVSGCKTRVAICKQVFR